MNEVRLHANTVSKREMYHLVNGVTVIDPATGKAKRQGILRTVESPAARDLRNLQDQEQAVREASEITDHFVRGNPGVTGKVDMNERWGGLWHPDHWADTDDATFEAMSWRFYHATRDRGSRALNAFAEAQFNSAGKMGSSRWQSLEDKIRGDLEKPYAPNVSFADLGAPNRAFGQGTFLKRTTIFRPSGWWAISTMKNNRWVADPGSIAFTIHVYHGSGQELRDFLAKFPKTVPMGYPGSAMPFLGDPNNQPSIIRFMLPDYQLAGSTVAPLVDEMGGKGATTPKDTFIWAYGHVYRDWNTWRRDVRGQIEAVNDSSFFSGGWCYTQINDTAQEKNGLMDPNGNWKDAKHIPEWTRIFQRAKAAQVQSIHSYMFARSGGISPKRAKTATNGEALAAPVKLKPQVKCPDLLVEKALAEAS